MSDFHYTLTRFCLRSGQLTLPQSMLELFPSEGSVKATDTVSNEDFELSMLSPRKVSGLSKFFSKHGLEVNDKLVIALKDDGRYAFTPLPHPKEANYQDPNEIARLLTDLYEKATPLSAAEIRKLYNDLPSEFPLAETLGADARFVLHEGRWHSDLTLAMPEEAVLAVQDVRAETTVVDGGAPQSAEIPGPIKRLTPLHETPSETLDAERTGGVQERSSRLAADPAGTERADSRRLEDTPPIRAGVKRASVIPYPRGVMFPGDAGLNSELEPGDLSQQQRIRLLLGKLGYRVEGLAHGQLTVHADLGRRHHSILIHILPEKSKLDWAALLARRREIGSDYLALIGHELDLIPFEAPADLARASLWPWHAVERLETLLELVPISPIDLESHFGRDGLFRRGLARFERGIQQRITERGQFSAVLARLAAMKAPAIFLLDDVVDAELSRDAVLKVLELLARAPFHLITKVDNGEFCLRFKVADSLVKLSHYSLSLRDRLPNRRTERLSSVQRSGGGLIPVLSDEALSETKPL